jgi:hypothetical protein
MQLQNAEAHRQQNLQRYVYLGAALMPHESETPCFFFILSLSSALEERRASSRGIARRRGSALLAC